MNIEKQMNQVLNRLGLLNWTAVWVPSRSIKKGEVFPQEKLIVVYTKNLEDAWDTFIHELLELKLRPVITPYRELCNALIGIIEKMTYHLKEQFIEELPEFLEIVTARRLLENV